MAECHPVAFRWPMKAKVEHGAKLIHVDPRFTRTSAMCDIYAPIRAGTDIAFLGGLINYVINDERWNTDPFFREYLLNYTNAATIVRRRLQGHRGAGRRLLRPDGVQARQARSGPSTASSASTRPILAVRPARRARCGEPRGGTRTRRRAGKTEAQRQARARASRSTPVDPLAAGSPLPQRDETLQHPRCVFQLVKRHFSRYTPEMVEQVTGCPPDTFMKVAETILENSGRDRTTALAYAVALDPAHQRSPDDRLLRPAPAAARQHRPARRRDHGAPRPRLDPGLDRRPHALSQHPRLHAGAFGAQGPRHAPGVPGDRGAGHRATGPTRPSSWSPISSRCTATRPPPENDFGYDWHPKITGDHSHMPMFVAMADGRVKGMLCIGQNPATSLNAALERKGMRQARVAGGARTTSSPRQRPSGITRPRSRRAR